MIQLKTIQTIHIGFCVAIFLFAIIVLLIIKDVLYFDLSSKNQNPLNFAGPAVAVLGLIMGQVMFKRTLGDTAKEKIDGNSKLVRFQVAFIIKCAFLEAGAFMNIIACLLTHNLFFMVFATLCFIAILISRPTKDSVYTTLGIQDTDLF